MEATGPRDAFGRPLSRREIDELVRESLRLEEDLDRLGEESLEDLLDRTPYRVAPVAHARRPRRSPRGPLLALLAVALTATLLIRPFSHQRPDTAATAPHSYTDGTYAFTRMQPDGRDQPIGYNPCSWVPVWVNWARATSDIKVRIDEAISEINAASGMHLVYAGPSNLRLASSSQSGGIVVAFNDARSERELDGSVVGVGGSASFPDGVPGATSYYVGGGVTLDVDGFNPAPPAVQRSILLHEFGHALGLGHVTGSTEIMNPSVNAASHYQHGDLTGLAKLGQLPCQ